ncbi:MAG: GAF domain-containing protein, partial [Calditrichaceae bacterium]
VQKLSSLNDRIQAVSDIDSLLHIIAQQVPKLLDCKYCHIGLYDKITQEIYYYKKTGQRNRSKQTFIRAQKGSGIFGWVAENLETVRIENAQEDIRFDKTIDEQGKFTAKSVLAVPMLSRDDLIGVLMAINQIKNNCFTITHEHLLKLIASLVAIHIDILCLSEENTSQTRLSDIGQSIASSAHGLKNILNNMDGGTYIVERGVAVKNMETVNKGWDILKRNSQRMREIVLDMLLFSRPRKPEYQPSDINKICWDIYELVRENATNRMIGFELDFDDRLKLVCIDPKGIYRCVLNLVSNAIDACSKSGGVIKIFTKCLENKGLQIKKSFQNITELLRSNPE